MIKKFINSALLASLMLLLSFAGNDFKSEQMKSSKVKKAYAAHWEKLKRLIDSNSVNPGDFDLYIRVFKQEKLLEAWVKNTGEKKFRFLKPFAICASSGVLGPKRQQGDLQVPEGFYTIPSLHPYSDYHLALKVGYPNKSDKLKATAPDPGGDIMIHGNCVTIGCIPLQDKPVEELFILSVEAMNRKRTVRCDIYPCHLSTLNIQKLEKAYDKEKVLFWQSLKIGYDYFELNHSLPQITTTNKGDYGIKPQ